MKKRTHRILSIMLTAAMVFSLNTTAFAAALADSDDHDDNDVEITYDNDGDAIIKNATNPVSWNGYNNDDELVAILFGGVNNHLANDKKITVSGESVISGSLSCNIMPVEGAADHYLIFAYGAQGMADIEGEGIVPLAKYDGRKIVYKKTGKDTASKHEVINAYLSLIKYDAGAKTVTEFGGVTINDLKMKNNVNANVSENCSCYLSTTKKLEGRELATFTVNTKVKFDKADNVDKAVKKGIAKTFKAQQFKLGILPMQISFGQSGKDVTDLHWKVSENSVTNYYDNIRASVNAKKIKADGTPKAVLTYSVFVGNNATREGKYVAKPVNAKGLSFSTGTVGGEKVVVLDAVNDPNYSYKLYEGKFRLCFRQKDKKTITNGIYTSDNDAYVDSVTE